MARVDASLDACACSTEDASSASEDKVGLDAIVASGSVRSGGGYTCIPDVRVVVECDGMDLPSAVSAFLHFEI